MYRTEAVGFVKVTSGHHQTDNPEQSAWVISTEDMLNDKQARALKNYEHVIHGVESIQQVNRRNFRITVAASSPEIEAKIVVSVMERFVEYLERSIAQQSIELAINSETSRFSSEDA